MAITAGLTPAQIAVQIRTLSKSLAKQMGHHEEENYTDEETEEGSNPLYDYEYGYHLDDLGDLIGQSEEQWVRALESCNRLPSLHIALLNAINTRRPVEGRKALTAYENEVRAYYKHVGLFRNRSSAAVNSARNIANKLRGGHAHPESIRKMAEDIYSYAMALPTHNAPATTDLEITLRAIIAILRARHPEELAGITHETIAENMKEEVNENAAPQEVVHGHSVEAVFIDEAVQNLHSPTGGVY